jgi:RHS repeat-associated protein
MMPNRKALLCHYHYDPLDRLIDCAPFAQATTRRFYLDGRLATEIQGTEQRSIMQHDDQLLAQQQRQSGTVETRLLATDRQRSVLSLLNANPPCPLAYAPYGHRPLGNGLLSLLGFNGERSDPVTGHYLLGNGYRAFNPVLMRFNSPDSWSPFGKGGLNAYGYCAGDPVGSSDPTGRSRYFAIVPRAISRNTNKIIKPNKLSPIPEIDETRPLRTPGSAHRIDTPIAPPQTTSPLESLPMDIFEKVTHTVAGTDMASLSQTSKTMNAKVTTVSDSRYQQMLHANKSDSDPQQFQFLITKGLVNGIAPSQIRKTDFPGSIHPSLPILYENRLIRGDVKLPKF